MTESRQPAPAPRASRDRARGRRLRDRRDRRAPPPRLARPASDSPDASSRAWTHERLRDDVRRHRRRLPARSARPSQFADAYREALPPPRPRRGCGSRAGHAALPGASVVGARARAARACSGTLSLQLHASTMPAKAPASRGRVRSRSRAAHRRARSRRHAAAPRATLLARDGSVLAEARRGGGPRDSPLATPRARSSAKSGRSRRRAARSKRRASRRRDRRRERPGAALDDRLRGRREASCSAGGARARVRPAHAATAVRTSVSPAVQRAAVDRARRTATAGSSRCDPRNWRDPRGRGHRPRRAAAAGLDVQDGHAHGRAASRPGAHRQHVFPYATYATLDGVQAEQRQRRGLRRLARAGLRGLLQLGLRPARRQARRAAPGRDGGTLRLQPRPGHRGAPPKARCPRPSQIQGELDVGSTAIGQGQVQASALQMAIVAATIADGGSRPTPTFTPERGAPRAALPRDERRGGAHTSGA